jgi:hypothetical protein
MTVRTIADPRQNNLGAECNEPNVPLMPASARHGVRTNIPVQPQVQNFALVFEASGCYKVEADL